MQTTEKTPASVVNSQFFQKIASGDPAEIQKQAEAATEYTRLTLREEGLARKVLPAEPITVADLDKQLDTDMPVKLVDKEVNQPLSASVPYGTLPRNFYMRGDRYRVDFARLMTRNFVADIRQLETYDYDIRDTYKENAIKDMALAEDIPFFSTVDAIVTPTSLPTTGAYSASAMASPLTGKVQYWDFSHASRNPFNNTNGFTRDSFVESFKLLTTGHRIGQGDDNVPIRLQTSTCVMNVNTALEFAKLRHDDLGGPGAEDLFRKGVTETTWMGRRFIYTIKDDIVLDGEMYMFSEPQFLGKFYELDAPTMFIDKRAFMLEFFVYSCVGASIGNPFGVSKVKFF